MILSSNIINVLSLIIQILFMMLSFNNINRKDNFNKTVFLISCFFVATSVLIVFTSLFFRNDVMQITKVLFLTLSLLSFIYLFFCIKNFNFIRLRVLFVPYFFFLFMVSHLVNYLSYDGLSNTQNLFENPMLSFHVILSLLSYTLLTLSVLTAASVYLLERNLKTDYSKKLNLIQVFPSIYESEKITINLLLLTELFLFFSLITGFIYSTIESTYLDFLLNNKSILSIITFILILLLLIKKILFGLSGRKIFNFVLASFLFINVAYFGLKFIE